METVASSSHQLPALPTMLAKSLLTLNRVDNQRAEKDELQHQFVTEAVSAKKLAAYQATFGGFVSDMPLAFFYSLAQRVHLAQMLDNQFPWPAPGLVHVSNTLRQHAAIDPTQGFRLDAVVKLPARGPDVSPRRLRPQFIVTFYQQDQQVVTCESTYQVMKGQQGDGGRKKVALKPFTPAPDWLHQCHWQLGSGMGRRYARISGDFNPIHLHSFCSRWFGFKKPIIHGMYMMARAQAEIERTVGQSANYIEVNFKRPVILPARVQLWVCKEEGQHRYEVRSADHRQVQLDGKIQLGNF
ncbi:MAG: MaoC family dehydratase [Pseudomonadota bacterium]